MGGCASKPPPESNPYTRRVASGYLQGMPQPKILPEMPRSRSLPLPSPAKDLKVALLRRYGSVKFSRGRTIKEGEGVELFKSFDLSNKFTSMFEVGEEIGRGHFWCTCSAVGKKGELRGRKVAVKIVPKSKMTTASATENIRREVEIMQILMGHPNLAQFFGAFEDVDNIYIVKELCKGGELLERMLARGGKYSEDDAKTIIVQILNAAAFLHLHGVVHRNMKPENFSFTSKDENSQLKAFDFGFSEFVRPDKNLKDIIGSAYYMAPEVLHQSYNTRADLWSIGVIAYVLLCGSRPFWAQTDSGIFQAVLKADPNFDEKPWPSLSPESKDFVRCLLRRDPKQRITAAQALCHPWLQKHVNIKVPIDIVTFELMKSYMQSSYLRKAALKAVSKTLTVDELYYLRKQFGQMYPDERGGITSETIQMGLLKNASGAPKCHIAYLLEPLNALQYRRMHFEEFCAAGLSVHQLKVLDSWEERTLHAYEIFEQNGNRVISIQELTSELGLSPSMTVHDVLQEWVRQSDGKLTFIAFVTLLCGQTTEIVYKDKDSPELKNGQPQV